MKEILKEKEKIKTLYVLLLLDIYLVKSIYFLEYDYGIFL
jgi:hypothetical protein